jgi:hypothetical protein
MTLKIYIVILLVMKLRGPVYTNSINIHDGRWRYFVILKSLYPSDGRYCALIQKTIPSFSSVKLLVTLFQVNFLRDCQYRGYEAQTKE